MDVYESVKKHFAKDKRVTINSGKGAQGMKVSVKGKPKMIIMFSKGDLLLKMPATVVTELIGKGRGEPYDPGTGKAMKDRILIKAAQKETWIEMTEMAIESARQL